MKTTLFWLLLMLPLLAAAQQPFPYVISGRIGQVPAPAKIYVRHNGQVLDSAALHNGYFTLRGSSQIPKQVDLLLALDGKLARPYIGTDYVTADYLKVFIEPTPVVLTSPDLLWHATRKGGPVNKDFAWLLEQRQALGKQMSTFFLEPEEGRRQSRQSKLLDIKFIKDNPSSWVSLDLLLSQRLGPAQYDEAAPLYALLSTSLKNNEPSRAYAQLLEGLKAVALGATAPDLTLPTPAGKPVAVQDYRGQYLLVEFWSSQCRECWRELAPTEELARKYANRRFAVLGISLDDPLHRKQWLRAIEENNLPGAQVSDLQGPMGRAARLYHVNRLPQNFLLDPAGRILAVNLYGDTLDAALIKYLPPFGVK
jgi:peroxiredoxin